MSKLRILCLHGFSSNGKIHALQTRSLTSALANDFDFLFPDGPHTVDMPSISDDPTSKAWSEYVSSNSTAGHRAWWFARDAGPTNPEAGSYVGLERSLDYLGEFIQKSGPIHGIWGFSQGGCFAGLLTALLSKQLKDHPLRKHLPASQPPPSAGIIISGFKARFPQYDSIYAKGVNLPTLHIIGEKDQAVTVERSQELVESCADPSVLRHGGAHEIPSSKEHQDIIVDFVSENVRSVNKVSL